MMRGLRYAIYDNSTRYESTGSIYCGFVVRCATNLYNKSNGWSLSHDVAMMLFTLRRMLKVSTQKDNFSILDIAR